MKTNLTTVALFLGLAFLISPHYLAAQDDAPIDDKDIKIVHFEELNYPPLARAARIEGAVVIRVSFDDRGNVVKAVAISGKEPLIDYCLANAKKWKFEPNARKMAVLVYHFTLPPAVCGPDFSFFMLEGNLVTITACPTRIDQ